MVLLGEAQKLQTNLPVLEERLKDAKLFLDTVSILPSELLFQVRSKIARNCIALSWTNRNFKETACM